MPLRLLYLTRESYPSFRPDLVTLFGEVLPARGVRSDLVALAAEDTNGRWPGGDVFVRCARGMVGRAVARFRLAFDLFRLSVDGYDAIQVRDRIFGAIVALLIARVRGLPFYFWLSFPFPESWLEIATGHAVYSAKLPTRIAYYMRGKMGGWLLYGVILRLADHVFVQSDEMKRRLIERGIRAGTMTPVPMGVKVPEELDAIAPMTDPRLFGRRVVVYLGALERVRHPEVMIEAIRAVRIACPEVLLVLVGDSQLEGDRLWLRRKVDEGGLTDHVLITGWLPPKDAWRYVRSAEIGLSPIPRTRTFEVASPTKVCEYLAYAVPVVANDQPDQAALIAATGGGICVPLTAQGFADGILALLQNPNRAQAMGQAGREAIGALRSYEVIGQTVAETYFSLLGRAQRGAD
jgi:glycosyltransferase involved in cell wall biosynthesis